MGKQLNMNIPQNQKKVDTVVDRLTLLDDDLMSRVFDQNIEATELILRIILEKEIKVISVKSQDVLKNHEIGGRNITLDIYAKDADGEEMDIEVQGNAEGAHVRRARYHSSMLDARMLKERQKFKELKDSYVIFIYRYDKFQKGLPIYRIDRHVNETNELFKDGSHIIYVNGNYKGDDEIGRLMEDFRESDSEKMNYSILARSVEHFKEGKGGREKMSQIVEEYAKEYAKECMQVEKVETVSTLMKNMKWTLNQALDALGIQGDERINISEQLKKL